MKRERNGDVSTDIEKDITALNLNIPQFPTDHSSAYVNDMQLFNESEVFQLKTVMQNEELRAEQIKVEELYSKYSRLFEFAPYGYLILSQSGSVLEINMEGAFLFGINREALINNVFVKLILPQDQQIFLLCLSNLIETRNHQVCEVRLSKPYNQEKYLRLALSVSENRDDFLVLVVMSDITLEKEIEKTQSFLLGCSWSESGKDFFEALAEYLGITLGMDYVCIDKLFESSLEAQTVAIYFDGNYEENVRYTLNDTPCGKVVGQMVCSFPSNVRHLFPRDLVLRDMVAESYVGITLWGSKGNPIGLIAVIGRKPLSDPRLTVAVLKQVSIRAAAELEHRQLEDKIIKSRDELEVLVNLKTAELQKTNELLRNEIDLRKQREQSLILAEEKYRTLADFTYDCETWLGPDGKYIYVSPSFFSTTGYTNDELMNDPELLIKITHPDDRELLKSHHKEVLKEKIDDCVFDFRIFRRNGELRWIGHRCRSVFNGEGKFLGQRGSNRDITEQKNGENILIESQKQLRALTQRIDAIAEAERTNIAREIHDELGHLLTAIKFDIEGLINKPDLSLANIKCELQDMTCMVDALIDTVRKISSELRPGILDHLGLFPAIEWQMRQLQKRSKIYCEYKLSEMDIKFDKNETNIIFRIVQEILTNVARHSHANRVSVSLSKNEDLFILTATDNGIGFELTENKNEVSFGLMGMRERAISIGGEIKIDSAPGKGTTVTFLLRKN